MNPARLGPPLYEEHGYRVRELYDSVRARSDGFTFEGPGFNAVVIYPSFSEALSALQSLLDSHVGSERQADPAGNCEPRASGASAPPMGEPNQNR
jgi:hypothetical protein